MWKSQTKKMPLVVLSAAMLFGLGFAGNTAKANTDSVRFGEFNSFDNRFAFRERDENQFRFCREDRFDGRNDFRECGFNRGRLMSTNKEELLERVYEADAGWDWQPRCANGARWSWKENRCKGGTKNYKDHQKKHHKD